MESFSEFMTKVLKRRKIDGKKKTKGNHPTIYECYNWVRDTYLKPAGIKGVNREEFYRIVKAVNTIVKEAYLEGYEFTFPYDTLRMRIQVKEGSRNISWIKTLKAWYEDTSLMEDKIRIKNDKKDRMPIIYGKVGNKVRNHSCYLFSPNRELKIQVTNRFNEGKLLI